MRNIPAVYDVIEALKEEQAQIAATLERLEALAGGAPPPQKEMIVSQKGNFVGLGIAEAAKRYLETVNRPQSTREIMKALRAGGLNVRRYQTVYGLLHRRKQQIHDVRNQSGLWHAVPPAEAHANH